MAKGNAAISITLSTINRVLSEMKMLFKKEFVIHNKIMYIVHSDVRVGFAVQYTGSHNGGQAVKQYYSTVFEYS